MKSIDLRQDPRMKKLFYLMGIEEVPPLAPISFEKTYEFEEWDPLLHQEEQEITETLQQSAIENVLGSELMVEQGVLSYKGRKVLVYIQEQEGAYANFSDGVSKYRFHVAQCSTLSQMKNASRSYRYRITRRVDGRAPVYPRHQRRSKTLLVEMKLCFNCRSKLKSSGLYPEPFSFASYFQQFDTDEQIEQYRSIRKGRRLETYTPDWDEISFRYRDELGWHCQLCQVCLEKERRLLHVHHVNRNQMDNSHENLRVLCVDCHANQPGHGFMRGVYGADIQHILALRKQQNID